MQYRIGMKKGYVVILHPPLNNTTRCYFSADLNYLKAKLSIPGFGGRSFGLSIHRSGEILWNTSFPLWQQHMFCKAEPFLKRNTSKMWFYSTSWTQIIATRCNDWGIVFHHVNSCHHLCQAACSHGVSNLECSMANLTNLGLYGLIPFWPYMFDKGYQQKSKLTIFVGQKWVC